MGWGVGQGEEEGEREGTALCAVHVSVGPCQPHTQPYVLVLLTH